MSEQRLEMSYSQRPTNLSKEKTRRLDNHVRMAKLRGTELLPDEDAVERQLRMLFWEGIKDSIKDNTGRTLANPSQH